MTTRVVVCYTGGVGSQVIRLLAAEPAFEIAGVLVHHEDKDGRDAGELAEIAPIGVQATRDVDALINLHADCALWHGFTWEPQVVARFLAAGTNVYSGMGGWYLPGEPEHDLLARACAEGDSTLVAGGNIPGLISDVLPLISDVLPLFISIRNALGRLSQVSVPGYVVAVEADTLRPLDTLTGEVRLLASSTFGTTPLVDNAGVTLPAR
ncbi:MAG TPA: hypothetical protein VGG75_00570 [Trebonia sp.]|jgi:hypothetical protein